MPDPITRRTKRPHSTYYLLILLSVYLHKYDNLVDPSCYKSTNNTNRELSLPISVTYEAVWTNYKCNINKYDFVPKLQEGGIKTWTQNIYT